MKDKLMDTKEIKTEKCVLCGRLTSVPIDLHVDMRYFYVQGVGQLCYECFVKPDKKN